MSVIFYADISEKLISSFGFDISLSALFDLESGDNPRFYAYSVQWAEFEEGSVSFLFSSCFFLLKWRESEHEAIV